MHIDVTVQCPVHDSFRVRQVAGLFDMALRATCSERFVVEMPDLNEPWSIGVIVGPSGSGKTTVARRAFGEHVCRGFDWPEALAVIDGFGDLPIKTITQTLTAVGFSSPPSWLKPYSVLSNGEKFRCDLARSLLRTEDLELRTEAQRQIENPLVRSPQSCSSLVVFDEFTSVVDRTVARIGSAAVARAIRGGKIAGRFVAVTCHYDVIEWLEPDWVLDMATRTLSRGRLRRPAIRLELFRCHHSAWKLFAKHHYLNSSLHPSSRCYLATSEEQPVAFCALLAAPPARDCKRVTRLVVLPDYQGVGIGSRVLDCVAELSFASGNRVGITTSHPAMIASLRYSRHWRCRGVRAHGFARHTSRRAAVSSAGRPVCSFEFVGIREGGRVGSAYAATNGRAQ